MKLPRWFEQFILELFEPWRRACCVVTVEIASDDEDEFEVPGLKLDDTLTRPHDNGLVSGSPISTEHHFVPPGMSPRAVSPAGLSNSSYHQEWGASLSSGTMSPDPNRVNATSADDRLPRCVEDISLSPCPSKENVEQREGKKTDSRHTEDSLGGIKKNPLTPTAKSPFPTKQYRQADEAAGRAHIRSRTSSSRRRTWNEEVLEEFLRATLIDGSGLVLMKRNDEGRDTKLRERIIAYNPQRMKFIWTNTGVLRKAGGIYAKDIEDVICDGKVVTIVSRGGISGATNTRESSLTWRGFESRSRRKVFEATKERDAQIFREILLLVRRKALGASTETTPTNSTSRAWS